MFGVFLFNLASPIFSFVATCLAMWLLTVLGVVIAASALIIQIGVPVLVYLCVFVTLKSCCLDVEQRELQQQLDNTVSNTLLSVLSVVVSAGFAVGVYLVLDVVSALAFQLGFYLINTAFEIGHPQA